MGYKAGDEQARPAAWAQGEQAARGDAAAQFASPAPSRMPLSKSSFLPRNSWITFSKTFIPYSKLG
ncbi:hypothetical protein [Lactococcus lactis]|uniref:hypothetical protein n=1 Tax=Lactococcus lactis TaxID=1358 RepID=UPI0003F6544A|nr:hypothetical protein [Lactococcus lactis]